MLDTGRKLSSFYGAIVACLLIQMVTSIFEFISIENSRTVKTVSGLAHAHISKGIIYPSIINSDNKYFCWRDYCMGTISGLDNGKMAEGGIDQNDQLIELKINDHEIFGENDKKHAQDQDIHSIIFYGASALTILVLMAISRKINKPTL